jgi:hypothetical protein
MSVGEKLLKQLIGFAVGSGFFIANRCSLTVSREAANQSDYAIQQLAEEDVVRC